eukprot:4961343-Prymnesium_polylepis.1
MRDATDRLVCAAAAAGAGGSHRPQYTRKEPAWGGIWARPCSAGAAASSACGVGRTGLHE